MDNAQKAIMIGVGLFITIIVIAAVMLITGIGQDLLNSGTSQLQGLSESLRVQITDEYDGKTFTKSQVRTACIDLITRAQPSITIALYASGYQYHLTENYYTKDFPSNGKVYVSYAGYFEKTISNLQYILNSKDSSGNMVYGKNNTQKFTGKVDYDSNTGMATVIFTKK